MTLLNGVGEFVSQKSLATLRAGGVLRGREHDVAARCVGQRVDFARRSCGAAALVNAHLPKVPPKALFKESSSGGVQRLPAAAQGSDLRLQFRGHLRSSPAPIVCLTMHLFFALRAEPLHTRRF